MFCRRQYAAHRRMVESNPQVDVLLDLNLPSRCMALEVLRKIKEDSPHAAPAGGGADHLAEG